MTYPSPKNAARRLRGAREPNVITQQLREDGKLASRVVLKRNARGVESYVIQFFNEAGIHQRFRDRVFESAEKLDEYFRSKADA
jgi:hypothetical protein